MIYYNLPRRLLQLLSHIYKGQVDQRICLYIVLRQMFIIVHRWPYQARDSAVKVRTEWPEGYSSARYDATKKNLFIILTDAVLLNMERFPRVGALFSIDCNLCLRWKTSTCIVSGK